MAVSRKEYEAAKEARDAALLVVADYLRRHPHEAPAAAPETELEVFEGPTMTYSEECEINVSEWYERAMVDIPVEYRASATMRFRSYSEGDEDGVQIFICYTNERTT